MPMNKFQRGMVVKNKAGRDGDQIYLVLRAKEEFVWVVDGDKRTIQKPKKKNPKHLQRTNKTAQIDINEQSKDLASENAKIRKEIKRIQTEVVDV